MISKNSPIIVEKMTPRTRKEIDTSTYTGRFAERLRMLREKKKLSVEELAEKSGIPLKTLYKCENRELSPGFERLPALAKSLSIKVRLLFPEE